MGAPFVVFPKASIGIQYHPLALRLHLVDPPFESCHPVFKAIRSLSWRVQVKVAETIGEEVYHPAPGSVGWVKLVKLFVDDSTASQALQQIVGREMVWSPARPEMSKPGWYGVLTPRAL